MNIVNHQQRVSVEVRIEIVVLQVRKRIAVRAVDQGQLQTMGEGVDWKRHLSRTFHEPDDLTAEERGPLDRSHAASAAIHRKDRVILAQM